MERQCVGKFIGTSRFRIQNCDCEVEEGERVSLDNGQPEVQKHGRVHLHVHVHVRTIRSVLVPRPDSGLQESGNTARDKHGGHKFGHNLVMQVRFILLQTQRTSDPVASKPELIHDDHKVLPNTKQLSKNTVLIKA